MRNPVNDFLEGFLDFLDDPLDVILNLDIWESLFYVLATLWINTLLLIGYYVEDHKGDLYDYNDTPEGFIPKGADASNIGEVW